RTRRVHYLHSEHSHHLHCLAMASSARGRNRRLLYKVKSSRASDGSVVYSCIFSCLDDVEHHRHRRNPFDPKYIQAALSSFDELGRDNFDRVATREEVEAASTSVHVRMELIKSMKDGLVKLTNDAVKHCKGAAKRVPKHKFTLEENKACGFDEGITPQQKSYACNFFEDDSINVYQRKFGQAFEALQVLRDDPGSLLYKCNMSPIMGSINLELAHVMDDLDSCLNGNANFMSEDELSFNINKETMEVLHDVLQRTPSDFRSIVHCEDGYADLSPFKGFISPSTKELILDFVTPTQSSENIEETTSQHDEVESKIPTKECLVWDSKNLCELVYQLCYVSDDGSPTTTVPECTELTKLHQMESAVPLDKPLDDSKVLHSLEPVDIRGVSAASSELDDISSPVEYYQDLMEIASADEMMEDISNEEAEDDIEDEEIAQHGANVNVQFCLENEDIEKFLAVRKQSKKSKSSWLVQDPEKLLLPATLKRNIEPKDEDIESVVESSGVTGRTFRQALSREGLDLILHFNLLQEDPSKIPGAFHFNSSAIDSEDFPTSSSFSQEPGFNSQNLEGSMHLNKENSHKEKKCWDNFSWPPGMAPTSQRSECMQSAECGAAPRTHQDCQSLQETETILLCHRSPILQDNALRIGDECWDKFSWSTATGVRSEYIEFGTHREDEDCCMKHSASLAAVADSLLPDDMGIEVHDTSKEGELAKVFQMESSNSIHSSGVVNEDDTPTETANQDDAVSQLKNQGMVTLEDSNLSCVFSQVASHQKTIPWVEESQNQGHRGERKRFHLDDLITGAVIAECQLHQNSYSHFDLEPLSRMLSTHMASIFKKQNTKSIVLKDLVAACNCAQNITLQRYVVALLSAAHQQNIGSWKDSRIEERQILLQEGVSRKLCDVEISILSPGSFP
ncbi:hypothetical protein GOP47_0021668, partial [Adiantum capillus-veneris]